MSVPTTASAPSAKRLQRPDPEAHKRTLETVDANIERIRAEISLANNPAAPSKADDAERSALRAKIRDIQSILRAKAGPGAGILPASLQRLEEKAAKIAQATPTTVEECDEAIAQLEKDVESGELSLLKERQANVQLANLRRARKALEVTAKSAPAPSPAPSKDKASKYAASSPEDLVKEVEAAHARLTALSLERDAESSRRAEARERKVDLQAELDQAHEEKRTLARDHRAATDAFLRFQVEERARRDKMHKERKAAEVREKKASLAREEREAADAPAFQAEIDICDAVSRYFRAILGEDVSATPSSASSTVPTGHLAPLAARKVDITNAPEGKALRRKGDREEEAYFVGKSSAKKAPTPSDTSSASASTSSPTPTPSRTPASFKVPLAVMEQLWDLKIDPPLTAADAPGTLEAITERRSWFLENQPRVTAENKAKAEKRIKDILGDADPSAPDANASIEEKVDATE